MKEFSFLKGLSWLLALNLLVKPVWVFFIDRQIQNIIGHEAYGNYFAIFNLAYVLLFIADAGLTNAVNQKAASAYPINTLQYLKLKLLLCFIYVLVGCFIGWITRLDQWPVLLYVIAIQLLTSLFLFLRSLVTANQFFTADAVLSVVDKTLVIIFCGALIYYPLTFGAITLLLFLKFQLLCTGMAVMLALIFVVRKKLVKAGEKEKFSDLLKTITPFALIILLMSMHNRVDGFLLQQLHTNGAYEAGIYASAYRLLDACSVLGFLAAGFLVPFVARHQSDKKMVEEVITNIRHGLLFFGIGAACFSFLFALWIQQLLYHSNDAYHTKVIQYCMAALPAYLLMHVYGSVLTATARFRSLILIMLGAVFVNLSLNLIFIPSYGAWGCCMAALISQYFAATSCYVAVSKNLQSRSTIKLVSLYIATAIGLSSLLYIGKATMLNVWLILVVAICIMLVLLALQLSYVKKYFIRTR